MAYNFYKGVVDVANSNTLIIERVFRRRILPTNSIWNSEDLENRKTFEGLADTFPEEARKELNSVSGHIVIFPPFFLKDVLKPSCSLGLFWPVCGHSWTDLRARLQQE